MIIFFTVIKTKTCIINRLNKINFVRYVHNEDDVLAKLEKINKKLDDSASSQSNDIISINKISNDLEKEKTRKFLDTDDRVINKGKSLSSELDSKSPEKISEIQYAEKRTNLPLTIKNENDSKTQTNNATSSVQSDTIENREQEIVNVQESPVLNTSTLDEVQVLMQQINVAGQLLIDRGDQNLRRAGIVLERTEQATQRYDSILRRTEQFIRSIGLRRMAILSGVGLGGIMLFWYTIKYRALPFTGMLQGVLGNVNTQMPNLTINLGTTMPSTTPVPINMPSAPTIFDSISPNSGTGWFLSGVMIAIFLLGKGKGK